MYQDGEPRWLQDSRPFIYLSHHASFADRRLGKEAVITQVWMPGSSIHVVCEQGFIGTLVLESVVVALTRLRRLLLFWFAISALFVISSICPDISASYG
jgi:hypothetical protein